MEAKTFIPTPRMAEVNRLIDGLLAEPFAVSQKIEDASLESIQTSFEEIDEAYADGSPPPEVEEVKDSYERCKEAFCLILMELEAMGATGQETLHDLRYRETGTQILVRPEAPKAPPAAPNLTLVPPPAVEWEEPAAEVSWKEHEEADSRINPKKISRPLPPPPPELAAPQPPAPPPPPMPASTAYVEVAEPSYIEVAPAPAVPEASLDPKAQEFWDKAEEFKKGVPSESAYRFEAQCRLFAVECEFWSQMREAVQVFWPHKESILQELADPQSQRFDFHPMLKAGLRLLSAEGREFLPDSGLPYSALRNCARFLMSGPTWDDFLPLPIEIGALLILFGGDRAMEGLILHNHLGLSGLTDAEAMEATFRLFRCQLARNRVLAPSGNGPDLQTVREDSERLLQLAKKLRLG